MKNLKILFVDDEINILQALNRMLHRHRQHWDMSFCNSGEQALERLQHEAFDVLVTDIRMPKVDGSRVLFESFLYHPETLRCVLSGYAERSQTLKVTGTAHQFLSKPCTLATVENMVLRAEQLKSRLPQLDIRRAVSRLSAVPCRPSILKQLVEELAREQPSPDLVANLIASDVGMSAKVIQLVASSFFGRSTQVYCPSEAITLLGVDLVASLLLEIGIFTPFLPDSQTLDIDLLCGRSITAAGVARATAVESGQDARSSNIAYLTHFMRDIGSIVLAHQFPELYKRLNRLVDTRQASQQEIEKQLFGASSADVGSYLLAIWGFPQEVVDAVGQADGLPTVSSAIGQSNVN